MWFSQVTLVSQVLCSLLGSGMGPVRLGICPLDPSWTFSEKAGDEAAFGFDFGVVKYVFTLLASASTSTSSRHLVNQLSVIFSNWPRPRIASFPTSAPRRIRSMISTANGLFALTQYKFTSTHYPLNAMF